MKIKKLTTFATMNKLKKHLLLVALPLIIFISFNAKAQVYQGNVSKFFVGGSLGLTFGSVTSITIMPELAYAITEDFFIGGGVRYSYFQDNTVVPVYKSTIWGGKLFLRYYILDNVFAHIEAERLYFQDPYQTNPTGNEWIFRDYFYGGGGYRQWVGSNSYMTMELLFDLTNNDYSFGSNPIFRIGFGVGL